jgi:hypothetical protein
MSRRGAAEIYQKNFRAHRGNSLSKVLGHGNHSVNWFNYTDKTWYSPGVDTSPIEGSAGSLLKDHMQLIVAWQSLRDHGKGLDRL